MDKCCFFMPQVALMYLHALYFRDRHFFLIFVCITVFIELPRQAYVCSYGK